MPTPLAVLAQLVHGRLTGDGQFEIERALPLSEATPRDISMLDHENNASRIAASAAGALIVPIKYAAASDRPTIHVADVHKAFIQIHQHLHPPRPQVRQGVSPQAWVSPSARIGEDVEIQAGAFVGDDVVIERSATIHSGARILAGCRIGEEVTIYPNAVLYENTRVGPRSVIHAGAIIGAHGFGYRQEQGRHVVAAQLGYVEIEADVDVGALSTIDRGTYGATVIGAGTKIDNLVMVAHNCRIGKHNLLCSQAGIAGSSTTGDYVILAGQAGVRDHVHIGTKAILGAKCGVMQDVPDGGHVLGSPAIPEREFWVHQVMFGRLSEMRRQLKSLTTAVHKLEAELAAADARGESAAPSLEAAAKPDANAQLDANASGAAPRQVGDKAA